MKVALWMTAVRTLRSGEWCGSCPINRFVCCQDEQKGRNKEMFLVAALKTVALTEDGSGSLGIAQLMSKILKLTIKAVSPMIPASICT